jgi:hypothetical protein
MSYNYLVCLNVFVSCLDINLFHIVTWNAINMMNK